MKKHVGATSSICYNLSKYEKLMCIKVMCFWIYSSFTEIERGFWLRPYAKL
jgi:hypothetical protein